jgi:NhaP-type Na+/H+ or K+/H+ antiporter
MNYNDIAILAVFICIYSAAAGGFERTLFGGAFIFISFGLFFGAYGLGFLELDVEAENLRLIAELALALVLFVDASKADLRVLSGSFRIPGRLILLALPLIILLGFGVGWTLFASLTILEVAILATMLAPTDAALGKAVVTNEDVPEEIREGLNIESGLNDGVCVPFFLAFLTLAINQESGQSINALIATFIVQEIGIGAVVGIVLSFLVANLLRYCLDRNWISPSWSQVPVVALAVACFAVAQALHGSGFIAAFVGGLVFGTISKEQNDRLVHAAEGTGDTIALITWIVFGATVIGRTADAFTWQVVVYAICSLTVIRMVPVFLAMTGLGLRTSEKIFVGWFGPRGLASVVFAVMIFNSGIPGADTIVATAVCTVLFSVLAHGASAIPLISLLSRTSDKKSS